MELIPTTPYGISRKARALRQSPKAFDTWVSKTINNLMQPSGSFTMAFTPTVRRWCAKRNQTECSNELCACDAKRLVIVEADSSKVLKQVELSGSPDVIKSLLKDDLP